MKTRSSRFMQSVSLTAMAVAGTVAASSAPVLAQDSSAIEEIVVTARKRSETLQDVPFSINAKTEEAMRNAGINNMEDLSTQIAGFSVQNLGPGQTQIAMRGISSGQIVRDQPGVKEQVGVYLDESVISLSLFTPDIDLFDMNRVEVLRGPQGTLFGSGSEAGTVRYITNKPNLEENEGVVEAQGSFIDGGEFAGVVKAMVNMPIAEGKAAIRAVAFYHGFGGFIDAVQPNLSVNEDVNGGRRIGARVAVEFRPSENLTITPRIVYQDVQVDGFNRQDVYNILANPYTTTRPAVTLGDNEQFTQLEENFTDEFMLLDATIQYDFGDMSFTSVTSYTDRDVLQVRDSTQLSGSVVYQFMDQTEGVFNLDSPLYDATEVEVFTQEARLASNSDGPLQWVAGVFYSKIDRNYSQILDVAGFEAATGIPTAGFPGGASTDELFYSRIPYDFKQIALFGEASYDVSDRMSVTAGVRWFDFEENRVLYFDGIFAAPTDGLVGNTKSDGFSPRVMVSYEASDNVQINAQASKGFRLGGINDPLNAGACTPEDLATFGGRDAFGNETLWNYEVGAKAKIMDGRGTFNVAAFVTPVSGMQFTVDAGTCSSRIVYNADARSMGVEAELFMRPSDNLEFSLVGSLIDSEVRESVAGAGLEAGGRLPTVPEFQMAGSMTYLMQYGDNEGFFTATVQHVGSRYTQAVDAINPDRTVDLTVIPIGAPNATSFAYSTELPSYTTGNLRFGLRNDRWEVAIFVNNIWNEQAKLAIDRERGTLARVGFLVNQPRTIGMSARAAF